MTNFDYPNGTQTEPEAISDSGEIDGLYLDGSGTYSGSIRRASGNFTAPLVDPQGTLTYVFGINDSGLVSGVYYAKSGRSRGFFYSRGTLTTYNLPGASEDELFALNNSGDLTGVYVQLKTVHAFVSIGGTRVEIKIPGSRLVIPGQLNESDAVVGYYRNADTYHGFCRDSQGNIHYPIDYPGATSTFLLGISSENWMTGEYSDAAGMGHGFVYHASDTFISFDYPGATYTELNAINRHGEIAGAYGDSAGNLPGFIAQLSSAN